MAFKDIFTKLAQDVRDRVREVVEYETPESEPVIFNIGAYGYQRAGLPAGDYARRDVLINLRTGERTYIEDESVQIQRRSCEMPTPRRAMHINEIGEFCDGISHLPPQEYAQRCVEYCEGAGKIDFDELAKLLHGVGEEEHLARLNEIEGDPLEESA